MKNVTITLDETVARWVRARAAEENRSVSRIVGEILLRHMMDEEQYGLAMQHFLAVRPRALKHRGAYPKREELRERR